MAQKKQLSAEELEKVTGGSSNSIVYVASVFRDGIDEDEISGYYDSQMSAFDAACERVAELMRLGADRTFVVKVYTYDLSSQVKEEVYSETINVEDYYKILR